MRNLAIVMILVGVLGAAGCRSRLDHAEKIVESLKTELRIESDRYAEREKRYQSELRSKMEQIRDLQNTHSDYPLFVRVPYRQLDKIVYDDLLAGKIPLRKGMRIEDGKLLEKSVSGKDIDWSELGLIGIIVFGWHYDNNGSYFVPLAEYATFKDRLPINHNGTMHVYMTEQNLATFRKTGNVRPDDEIYVLDTTDNCYRFFPDLGRVPDGWKLKRDGKPLSQTKPDLYCDADNGTIRQLLEWHDIPRLKHKPPPEQRP